MKYEEKAYDELLAWQREIRKKRGFLRRISKSVQNKFNDLLPEKFHDIMTEAVKGMIETVLTGSKIFFASPFQKLIHWKRKKS